MPDKITNTALIGGGTASVVPDIVNKSGQACAHLPIDAPSTLFQYPLYVSDSIVFVPQDIVTIIGLCAVILGIFRATKKGRNNGY